jgi:Icc-related predicted phosphoesterase
LLITHGPPYGILDNGKSGKNVGSKHLLEVVKKIKPRYHIFGHIHESTGMNKIENTFYLNVCNSATRLVWK